MSDKKPFFKKPVFWIIVAVLLIIGVSSLPEVEENTNSTTATDTTQNQEVIEDQPKQWVSDFTLSGSGTKKTEPFTISSDRFKIKYSFQDTSGFGVGILDISTKRASGQTVDYASVYVSGETVEDETIVYGSGEVYLDISSVNGNWKIEVEQYR